MRRRQFFDTPPLHYTGGKWKVADWIIGQFPPHDIYVEPFCGGASVFFRKHASQVEVLNDLDGDIINFFDVLRDQTDVLLRAIERTPWARAEYERAVGEPASDPLERARRFYVGCWQSFGGTLVNRSGWRHQRRAQQYTPLTQSWKRRDGLLDAAERLRDAQTRAGTASKCCGYPRVRRRCLRCRCLQTTGKRGDVLTAVNTERTGK